MKKKTIALFLVMMMLLSLMPVSAFADDEAVQEPVPVQDAAPPAPVSAPDPAVAAANAVLASGDVAVPAPVGEPALAGAAAPTPGEVDSALDTAAASAQNAADEFAPLSQDKIDETAAANLENAADAHLNNAENIVNGTDGFTGAMAGLAEGNENKADADLGTANAAADAAEQGAEDAEAAEKKVDVNAAKTAAGNAQQAAADAAAAAADAAAAAQAAEAEYQIAQAAYQAAAAEVEDQLALGLIDAEQAANLTKDAAERADAAYNTMLETQAAADKAQQDAQAAADAADKELQESIDALDQAIADNAKTVGEKTAVTALTGAALAAAKLAAEAAQLQVGYYEGEIEEREEEIAELQKKIDDAKQAIEDAEQAVEDAKAELALKEQDDDYQQAVENLKQAEDNLKGALDTIDTLQDIVDALSEDEGVQGAEALMDAVKDGSATADNKKALTEYVFGNLSLYGGEGAENKTVTWVTLPEGDDRLIFELDGKYYQVVTVEGDAAVEAGGNDSFIQFQEMDQTYFVEAAASDIPANDDWSSLQNDNAIDTKIGLITIQYGTKFTGLSAVEENDGLPVVLKKSFTYKNLKISYSYTLQVKDGNSYNDLKQDANGYYYTKNNQRHDVTLCVTDDEAHYNLKETTFGTTSKTLEDAWAEAEKNLQEAKDAANLLQQAEGQAVEAYAAAALASGVTAAQAALATAEAALEDLKKNTDTSADEARIEELKAELRELDKKLNGSLGEQLAVAFMDGGASAVAATLKESEVPIYLLSEEEQAQYQEYEDQIAEKQARIDALGNSLSDLVEKGTLYVQIEGIRAKELPLEAKATAAAANQAAEQGAELLGYYQTLSDGEFTMDDVESLLNLVTTNSISAKTKERIIDKIVEVLEGVHENAVEELKEAVEKGLEEVAAAGETAAQATADAAEAHAALALADAAKTLADALTEQAKDRKDAADQAAADAAAAARAYKELVDTYGPTAENVQRAKAAALAAAEKAAEAAEEAERAQEAADRAQEAYKRCKAEYDRLHSGGVERTSLGVLIAEYAWSLRGSRYAELVGNDPAKLNSKAFAETVFAHFNIKLKLDGSVADIAANGSQVNKTMRMPGDLIVMTADGAVSGFGVNFDLGNVVIFNEKTGNVEMAGRNDLGTDFAAVRIV